jgi:hypothetical protein
LQVLIVQSLVFEGADAPDDAGAAAVEKEEVWPEKAQIALPRP